MEYISTRGGMPPQLFSDVLLMGLASDGGLIMPEHYPQISLSTLNAWRNLSYPELTFEILRRYSNDIPQSTLRAIAATTYTANAFTHQAITPLTRLSDGLAILELAHGPTLAFKDLAMQLLGNLYEFVLARRGTSLNILGATSGDTGSAAEYAMRGKQNIQVFMLSPVGRMSAFQRAQMYSLMDDNIYNLAIQGTFDDCQDIVKAVSNDLLFKSEHRIGTVNSINWARIVAQVVYYFSAYFKATTSNDEQVSFCVPSGNFGNVCSGHIARQMGLPIDRLIVATNENDVLCEFLTQGRYRPRRSTEVQITSSPSMDISKASNLERFVFDLVGRDPGVTSQLWGAVDSGGGFDLSHDVCFTTGITHYGFVAARSTHAERITTIRSVYQNDKRILDPHTADGINVARKLRRADENVVCLETALPVKFAPTIWEALELEPALPPALADLERLPQRVWTLPVSAGRVKAFISGERNISAL